MNIAVVFSGGPAPGGHDVISGIYDAMNPGDQLLGALQGPIGLVNGDFQVLDSEIIERFRGTGGFHMLGSARLKIKSSEQFDLVRAVVSNYNLDAIVMVGGDDSNTNAFFLAQELEAVNCQVIGVPKTIDGDLQVEGKLPISFGFDTATKIYSELVGNLLVDCASSLKYWHFVKLMGRSSSLVTLEVALQTQPHITLISEEVASKKWTINDVVSYVGERISERVIAGTDYGVVLIPEGLLEVLPPFKTPDSLASQFRGKTDDHGNINLSKMPTEQLLAEMVKDECSKQFDLKYHTHFYGYEGRCGKPSLFDQCFATALGKTAARLVYDGYTGYMAYVGNLNGEWEDGGIALDSLLHEEVREAGLVKVIAKTLVDLSSKAFQEFVTNRDSWLKEGQFKSPGPRQFCAEEDMVLPLTVEMNS
jgi:pyrophosphate--fructose-6-phosphate 1-phosphotransferase